ncbi:L,D-transpeptidase family protein [Fontivita pretiosa]|uniref:L,D-transpeptidase family protein n=1 Tax=Fontivita pretiosa TaxID=2989684 RepID=UPI003D16E787
MGRYGRRISRSLIGVLIVTLVLGGLFYLKDLSTSDAEQTPAQAVRAPSPPRHSAAAPPRVLPSATQPGATTAPSPTTAPTPLRNARDSGTSTDLFTHAQRKRDAGDVLAARAMLNDALLSGRLSGSDVDRAKQLISQINQTVVFSSQRFDGDPFGGTYTVQSGDLLRKIADKYDVTWELLARLNGLSDPRKLRAGQTIKVIHGPFNAVVYKSRFMMDIYLGPPMESGCMYITSYPVGLGKDDSTPTGSWLVEPQKKLKNPTYYSPRGEGVIAADDPANPLGERWIGLSGIDGHAVGKSSYGIHGTIDESSIGKMESMGCIRLKNADVEWLYDLLVEGKSVVVVKE